MIYTVIFLLFFIDSVDDEILSANLAQHRVVRLLCIFYLICYSFIIFIKIFLYCFRQHAPEGSLGLFPL